MGRDQHSQLDSRPARMGLLWGSTAGMGVCYLCLNKRFESIIQGFNSKLSPYPSSVTSSYILLAGSLVAAIAYAVASHSIYIRAERSASTAILACLVLLGCQTILAPSIIADAERLLVFMPLSICIGLSWADSQTHGESRPSTYSAEKSYSHQWR